MTHFREKKNYSHHESILVKAIIQISKLKALLKEKLIKYLHILSDLLQDEYISISGNKLLRYEDFVNYKKKTILV